MTKSAPSIILRGICGRCPACGEGKIFQAYLKPREICPVCGQDFSRFRADDGPAWLTILLTGHIVVPASMYLAFHDSLMPLWAAGAFLFTLTVALVLALLPRAKGAFIAVMWLLATQKSATSPNP